MVAVNECWRVVVNAGVVAVNAGVGSSECWSVVGNAEW